MRPLPSEVSPTARGIGVALSPGRFVCHFACSLRASSPFFASERGCRKGPLSRLLSRASRASTFHDIPQRESLLAGYFE